jgi:hypothetical protein
MTEITQEQIDKIRKIASRNICDCESCRKEFDYVFKLAWQKAHKHYKEGVEDSFKVGYLKGKEQERNRILEIIKRFMEVNEELKNDNVDACLRILKSQINPEDKTA